MAGETLRRGAAVPNAGPDPCQRRRRGTRDTMTNYPRRQMTIMLEEGRVSRTNTGSDDGSGSDDIPSIARRVIAAVRRPVGRRTAPDKRRRDPVLDHCRFRRRRSGRVAQCGTAAWTMPPHRNRLHYDPVEVYLVPFGTRSGTRSRSVSRGSSTQPDAVQPRSGRRGTSSPGYRRGRVPRRVQHRDWGQLVVRLLRLH